jgi:hypothetical protein
MDRDTAAKLEGMMLASRSQLQYVAELVRVQVPPPQQRIIMLKIAAALAELIDVSRAIHDEHPHLDPHREEGALAAEMHRASEPDSGRS